jgi:hypothetical protein
MKTWGPADWAAVASGAVVTLGLLAKLLSAFAEVEWRDIWPARRAQCDPRDKLPYRRPVDGS